ncbi:MAG TPA: hypothetical protein PKA66_13635 [Gemmatimonadales bacterium]|nr:hypothetical protein [Gemmatimonadales bacterium]
MRLNRLGVIVRTVWRESDEHFPAITFGVSVVMPDHFHGIVIINNDCVGSGDRRGTACRAPTVPATPRHAPAASATTRHVDPAPRTPAFGQPIAGSIPTIVGAFKSAVTKRVNVIRGTPGARVWQRNYYECILADERAVRRVEAYIRNNPARE